MERAGEMRTFMQAAVMVVWLSLHLTSTSALPGSGGCVFRRCRVKVVIIKACLARGADLRWCVLAMPWQGPCCGACKSVPPTHTFL